MADGGKQSPRQNESNRSSLSHAGPDVHFRSVTGGGSSMQEMEMDIRPLEVEDQTMSLCNIMEGSTYEIDHKSLPPEAPLTFRSIRAVLVSKMTGKEVTVNYPSTTSLENFFRKFPAYTVQGHQHTPRKLTGYPMQMGYVEPLMGTKPDLDENFDMATDTAERVLVREISCTEYLHQAHLKSFWLMGRGSTQSSEANLRDGTTQDELWIKHQKGGGNGNVLTHDFCDKFDSSWAEGPSRRDSGVLQHPWKKSRVAPQGQLWQSRMNTNEIPIAMSPMTPHSNSSQLDGPLCHVFLSETHGDLKGTEFKTEEPFRWGCKKKVNSNGVNFNFNHICDVRDNHVTGVTEDLKEPKHDLYKRRVLPIDNEVNLVPYNFMQSNRGPWSASFSSTPASGKLYSPQASTSTGLKRSVSSNALSLRDKSTKLHQNRSPINVLKLPKDMQGRWSSERYKSAQLKLIDIMHERRAAPGRPILRPALREEARKHIGDTGLLDHLLKHMTDTIVSTGERFRRRHNAEGAMEYWLEDASLMGIRKAAGVEDPSWLPPQGWKPGDNLQGGSWEFRCGMSSSEAAEMKQLKETVGKLKSDMRFLCGRLGEVKQEEIGLRLLHHNNVTDKVARDQMPHFEIPVDTNRTRQEAELNKKIESIIMEVKDFRQDMTALQKKYEKDIKPDCTPLERSPNLEHIEAQPPIKDQQEAKMGIRRNDLEKQLADVRKEVDFMQTDVHYISKVLGVPHYIRSEPHSHPCQRRSGTGMPLLLLSDGEQGMRPATVLSERRQTPPSSSFQENQGGNLEAPYDLSRRQIIGVNSATSSSNEAAAPFTTETNPAIKDNLAVWNTSASNDIALISPTKNLSTQQVKASNDAGSFRVCRPKASSVLWQSAKVGSHHGTTHSSLAEPNRWEDFISLHPRDIASTTSSPEGSSQFRPTGAAGASAKECHVAAAMAEMFGCMAPQQIIQGDHSGQTTYRNAYQQQPRSMKVSDSVPLAATWPHQGTFGNNFQFMPPDSERKLNASPPSSIVSPLCPPAVGQNRTHPLALSLSLTLGSRATSDHNEADPTEKNLS